MAEVVIQLGIMVHRVKGAKAWFRTAKDCSEL
jgi:hypothetical protein